MAENRRQARRDTVSSGLSCEMCNVPDEPADMLHVDVNRPDGELVRTAHLCRRCIAAILASAKDLMESETQDEPEHG